LAEAPVQRGFSEPPTIFVTSQLEVGQSIKHG